MQQFDVEAAGRARPSRNIPRDPDRFTIVTLDMVLKKSQQEWFWSGLFIGDDLSFCVPSCPAPNCSHRHHKTQDR